MGGGCGSGVGTMPNIKTVYVARHAQKGFGSSDPSLMTRGFEQASEISRKYLANINFDAIYRGIHIRHIETAVVAKVTLGQSCDILETPMLSSTDAMHKAGDQCVIAGLKHPDGPAIGFRVDTWNEIDPVLMDDCREQFANFIREIPTTENTILAISSCPIIESAVLQPEKTRLLGDCGIIKYVIDDAGAILSSEVIFEGFFEKPPQKKSS